MRSLRNAILSNEEADLLRFLWKYRVATFRTLKTIYFPTRSSKSAYDRCRKMEAGQFVAIEKIPGQKDRVFRLDRRGFQYLQANVLPNLKTKYYKPQSHYHDLVASAALIGDWLYKPLGSVRIVSEQEIKSVDIPEINKAFPNGLSHDPDGIWIFRSGKANRYLGLEVEISGKTDRRYEEVCAFYSSDTFFEHVFWIVKSREHGNQILECSQRHGIPREGVHLMVLLEDFKMNLWDSVVRNGNFKDLPMGLVLNAIANDTDPRNSESGVTYRSSSGHIGVIKAGRSPLLDFGFSLNNSAVSSAAASPNSQ